MKIGIPKELLNNENRVALTPSGVHTLTQAGHAITIETNAGLGSGFTDEEYEEMGAKIVKTAKEAWSNEMIMKVKEPIDSEYDYLQEGQIVFTYFHLASQPELTKVLIEKR